MGTDLHELTAAYALGALDPDERSAYEAHLATCDRCRRDLAALEDAAAQLAYAAPAPAPPSELRQRVLEAVRADGGVVVPLRHRSRLTYAMGAVAVAASTIAVAVGIWATGLASERDELRALADARARVHEITAGPAAGRLYVSRDGTATLVVDSDPAPVGKDFEIWVIDRGEPRRAGLYDGGRSVVVRLTRPVPRGASVAVTLERDGGVDAPTTEPLFVIRT